MIIIIFIYEYEYTNDGNNIRARIFNNDSDTTYHSATGQPAFPAIKLAFGNNVDIGEVVYYNSALTSTNSNTVCNYLMTKWGLKYLTIIIYKCYKTKLKNLTRKM